MMILLQLMLVSCTKLEFDGFDPTTSALKWIMKVDKNVMELFHETLGVGTLRERKFLKEYAKNWKKQYRWSASHRQALYVCKLFWPYSIVKLEKIEKIIDHYEPDIQSLDDSVIDLALERERRNV